MPQLQVNDLSADDLDDLLDVRSRSFGPFTGDLDAWRRQVIKFIETRRIIGAFDGDRLVAAAQIWDFGQWWHGRTVPMAGVAGVVVAPEYRGGGTGSLIMRAMMQRSIEFGFPLTALYPATVPIYRKLGFEFGGARHTFTFDAAALRSLGHTEVVVRRGGPDDAGRLLELVAAVRGPGRASGPLVWPEDRVREWLSEKESFCYLADDGFIVYRWNGDKLAVDEIAAASGATARALWATVGSGSSIAKQVDAFLSPDDPIHLMLPLEAVHETHIERWMFRLLDAPAAIAGRGWPPGVEIDQLLTLDDPEITANAGTWRLRVSGGEGSLTRAEGEGLGLGARGLSALYAGTPLATLRIAGLAEGKADDEAIDAAFAGATTYILDYF